MISKQRKVDMAQPVSKDQVEAIEKLVAPEFAKGNWEIEEMGSELLDKAASDPTINIYLDRSPKLNTTIDYFEMVKRLHRQRAAFITAEQKKKEPKIEGEE